MQEKVAEKLREAFDRFPRLVQEVNVVRAYCEGSHRAARSDLQKPLQDFIGEFKGAWTNSRSQFVPTWPAEVKCTSPRVADVAVLYAWPLFWEPLEELARPEVVNNSDFSKRLTDLSSTAERLSCLLVPVPDELLPAEEHGWQLWKAFADAELLWRQCCILTACWTSSRARLQPCDPLWQAVIRVRRTVMLFQKQHLQLVKEGNLSPNLDRMMTELAKELLEWDNNLSPGIFSNLWGYEYPCPGTCTAMIQRFTEAAIRLTQQASLIVGKASQIATLLSISTSPDVNSLGSWSAVSNAEVGSVASCNSVASQTSYLSGRGGPHCFLPSHLFKQLLSTEERSSTSFVLAQAPGLQCLGKNERDIAS